MLLAGIQVPDRLVLTLARMLRDAELYMTADRLETACNEETEVLALTIAERDEILRVLVECPPGLGISARCCFKRKRGGGARGSALSPLRASFAVPEDLPGRSGRNRGDSARSDLTCSRSAAAN